MLRRVLLWPERHRRLIFLAVVGAQLMEQAGFNVVRLPISWSELEPVRGQINTSYLDQIQQTVEMLNAHNLYVILDMHFSLDWSPRFGGTGAPDWAVVPGVPTGVWQPPNTSWKISLGILAAHDYFWTSSDWQADFDMVWQAVARRFRDDSGIVGYDLYNEPEPFPIPAHLFEENWMWPVYSRTINAIGAVDSNHLFLIEGILLWDFPTTMDHLLAPNLVWAPHVYTGALVPPEYPLFPNRLPQAIHDDAWDAQQVPAALWVGVAAPAGIAPGRGDGVHGTLSIHVSPQHTDQSVLISWPTLTAQPPQVQGTCVRSMAWQPEVARLELTLMPGTGCTIQLTAPAGVANSASTTPTNQPT